MITWDPVLVDCHGAPEVVVGYAVLLAAIWISGWVQCGDPPVPCPQYSMTDWTTLALVQAPAYDWSGRTPCVGCVDVYEIEAVDAAGNWSGQQCDDP